ncbi:hypothetical protein ACWGI8_15945, partial [Streptomyces sp. NPDC054841]
PGMLGTLAAEASLLAAVMFYLGAVYLTAYYDYFRVDAFNLGIGFSELAIQALNLVSEPVVVVVTLTTLILLRPPSPARLRLPPGPAALLRHAILAVTHSYVVLLPAGILVFVLGGRLQRFAWAAALALAVSVILVHRRAAHQEQEAGQGTGPVRRVVAMAVSGALVLWAVSLAANQIGVADARQNGRNVIHRTAVVVLSTDRLSLAGPGIRVEDLGKEAHLRYRYTGLRRLIERGGKYYLLPVGWNRKTGTTYIINEGDGIRVELMPGTQ